MIDADFIRWLISDVGALVVVIILGAKVAGKALDYLREQAEADKARQDSWDANAKKKDDQWLAMMAGYKIAIEGLGLTHAEMYKLTKDDRVTMMAYQNTTSTALAELLVAIKDLRTLPDTLKKVQSDLTGQLTKMQTTFIETDSRHHLEQTKHSASTNNAILEVQKSITRIERALEKLPTAMQSTLAPMVLMLEQVLSSAQATQAKIDDLPLMNRVVEKDLLEGNGASSTDGKNAVPTNTGDIHIIPTGETVVAE